MTPYFSEPQENFVQSEVVQLTLQKFYTAHAYLLQFIKAVYPSKMQHYFPLDYLRKGLPLLLSNCTRRRTENFGPCNSNKAKILKSQNLEPPFGRSYPHFSTLWGAHTQFFFISLNRYLQFTHLRLIICHIFVSMVSECRFNVFCLCCNYVRYILKFIICFGFCVILLLFVIINVMLSVHYIFKFLFYL